jgi:hypothetical protein
VANFYKIHEKAIERAFNVVTKRPGDCFRIDVKEPLEPPSSFPPKNEFMTIITFRRLPEGRFEPATDDDRRVISEWNNAHRDDPDDAWDLPNFLLPS